MAVKGAILGDILGSQYEFKRPKNLDYNHIPLLIEDKASFTDDTVMTLAIKKAILEQGDYATTMAEVGSKYPWCGYGQMFFRWIFSKKERKPYNSFGNGSAMRVSFVGEYFENYEQMQEVAKQTAIVSHNHPEGIKGAIVTATCIWMGKHGKSKEEIYNYVLQEYPAKDYEYSIAYSLDEIRDKYKWNETCFGSVPVAMRCFYESTDYESFMRNIYSLNCDSDTLGAIAGGVVEEYYHGFGTIDVDKIIKKYLTDDLYEILNKS